MNEDLLKRMNLNYIDELIEIAFRAREKCGNRGSWFTYFNRSMDGLRARIYGLKRHYNCLQSMSNIIHETLEIGPLTEDDIIKIDHHVSDILFNLDSAIECFVFALNAIGYGIMDKNGFLSIEDDNKLTSIGPKNVFKNDKLKYKKYFPILVKYWVEDSEIKGYVTPEKLWMSIRDQHDVSKHRSRIYDGHMGSNNEIDIILDINPKKALDKKPIVNYDVCYPWTLDDHIKEFICFINRSFNAIHQDLINFLKT